MERGDSLRRASDEARKVNFAEESASSQQPHAKELTKKDSFRGSTGSGPSDGSPRQHKKFITTWRNACDKTKDRTKELLKKWRTMPEGTMVQVREQDGQDMEHSWSVHVWATWVKRYPSDEDALDSDRTVLNLTDVQKEKLQHFFSHVYDMDRDDIISLQDFESFTERIRHFADWSTNCGEYLVLEQVQHGFIETFILPLKPDSTSETENAQPFNLNRLFLSIEDWLFFWNELLDGVKSFSDLPIWLQYFPKVLFNAINKSGSGAISRDELSAFYSSVMGFSTQRVGEIINKAFRAMTANGDFKLDYSVYRLTFANFLLGRFPNGPGQYFFGCTIKEPPIFPIDYSMLNSQPEDMECYSLSRKQTNRTSIIGGIQEIKGERLQSH